MYEKQNKWNKEHLKQIKTFLNDTTDMDLRELVDNCGMSTSNLIKVALREYKERHNEQVKSRT